MRIPNSFVTRFTQASDLKLACVFYSLIHKNTKRNLLGYEITVKQTTLVYPLLSVRQAHCSRVGLSSPRSAKQMLPESLAHIHTLLKPYLQLLNISPLTKSL